jgi:hypothetical protein
MDVPIMEAPGQKAQVASNRAKRVFFVICVLLAANLYLSEEKSASQAAGQVMSRQIHAMLPALAVKLGDTGSVKVRNLFYDRRDRVYCGEVNGHGAGGDERAFNDGVRIFVCSPAGREQPGR